MTSLQYVEKGAYADPPIIALFPAGVPDVIAEQPDFRFKYYSGDDEKKGVIFGGTNQVHFVGKNYGNSTVSKSRNNYAIALVKPGKAAKVVSATGLFTVRQVNNADANGIDEETITESDFNTMRAELTERFGSLKRRRDLRSQEANKFNINSNESSLLAVQKAMGSAASLAQGLGEREVSESSRARFLPPHNATTDKPEEIYRFKDILGKKAQASIDANILINPPESPEELQSMYPKFVLLHRPRLKALSDELAIKFSRILLYITYLLRLFRLPRHYLSESLSPSLLCSEQVAEVIANTFTTNGEFTKERKAKLICYTLILAIMITPAYCLEADSLQALSNDLKMTVSDLLPYLREVGCINATKEKGRLTAPLRLPEIGKRGGSKRR